MTSAYHSRSAFHTSKHARARRTSSRSLRRSSASSCANSKPHSSSRLAMSGKFRVAASLEARCNASIKSTSNAAAAPFSAVRALSSTIAASTPRVRRDNRKGGPIAKPAAPVHATCCRTRTAEGDHRGQRNFRYPTRPPTRPAAAVAACATSLAGLGRAANATLGRAVDRWLHRRERVD